ncbi:hypothetical protein BDQ17DRAFT_1360324 [Cyathus striatus]|nr:hypothetical protein BDQ17DRAFT_1360324 [Cyathus striatus]
METRLNYELPSTIRSLRDGWQSTCQNASIISASLTVTGAILLAFFKQSGVFSTNTDNPQESRTFLLVICYVALFFNISASISAFILTDKLGELPLTAARKRDSALPPSAASITADSNRLLKSYGIGRTWILVQWHWFLCYVGGLWLIFVQILTYVILEESKAIRITVSCFGGFSMLSCLFLIIPRIQRSEEYPSSNA